MLIRSKNVVTLGPLHCNNCLKPFSSNECSAISGDQGSIARWGQFPSEEISVAGKPQWYAVSGTHTEPCKADCISISVILIILLPGRGSLVLCSQKVCTYFAVAFVTSICLTVLQVLQWALQPYRGQVTPGIEMCQRNMDCWTKMR